MTTSRTPWDEDGIGESDIAVREQNAIAVYRNAHGEVSLRQQCWPDDDVIITVAPENARQLCDAILRVAAELAGEAAELDDDDSDDSPPPTRQRPKARTAAERMRRHRAAKRNGDRNGDRNGATLTFAMSPDNDDQETRARRHL